MDERTKRGLRRGVAGLVWADSRLQEIEKSQGSSPDLLRLQRDCASLLGRLSEDGWEAQEPDFDWHSMLPVLLSGLDLAFLQSLCRFLAEDQKGGGGHLQALIKLEQILAGLIGD